VFETGPLDGRIYATLRDALAAAIVGLNSTRDSSPPSPRR
jgi:hypothetical protein